MAATVIIGTSEGIRGFASADRDLADHPRVDEPVDHVVVVDGVVWALTNGTTVWRDAESVAVISERRANCILPLESGALVGAEEAALFGVDGSGQVERVRSFDDAPGREGWYTPWGGAPDVRSMARGVEGNLYVNVHVGGVVRSVDGGNTWHDTMDIDADVHEVRADPTRPGHAFVASAIGLGTTADGGENWSFTIDGLHDSYCRAVAISEDSVFVSASLGSQGRQAALYRRNRLHEGPLTRCVDGLPEWLSTNLNTFCLAAQGHTVVAGDANGTVYLSRDEGRTWEPLVADLPEVRCVALA